MAWMRRPLLWLAPWLMLGLALWRVATGRETRADLAQRLGAGHPAPTWVHGASNGELASARWLIEELARRGPVQVTASTVTGRQMVRGWGIAGVTSGLAPLDLGFALRRFLAAPPRVFINLEGEFWPRRLDALRARGVRIALLGARMSERSAQFWAGAHLLRGIDLVSAQDEASRRRLEALGAGGGVFDLKSEAIARLPRPAWAPRAARASVMLAASTHAGEEGPVLAAFAGSGFRLLILAPRHPRRAEEVAGLIRAQGQADLRRSRGDALPERGIYLADTMGEMDLWYAAAGVCFVGGSLVDKGGHTPWEPVRHGAAVLHGPHVGNFRAAYAALGAAGATGDLADLAGLDAAEQERRAQAALCLLRPEAGAALLAAVFALYTEK